MKEPCSFEEQLDPGIRKLTCFGVSLSPLLPWLASKSLPSGLDSLTLRTICSETILGEMKNFFNMSLTRHQTHFSKFVDLKLRYFKNYRLSGYTDIYPLPPQHTHHSLTFSRIKSHLRLIAWPTAINLYLRIPKV